MSASLGLRQSFRRTMVTRKEGEKGIVLDCGIDQKFTETDKHFA